MNDRRKKMQATTMTDVVNNVEINKPRLLTFLFGFCMFSTGGTGLVNEYVLATMTTYILGNSIEQFSIVIASMMLMMGLSGLIQKAVTDKNLIEKFMGIEITMAVLGGFAPVAIYWAFGNMTDNFVFVHYFFVLTIGFLIGFEIPIVMRIIDQYGVGIKDNLKIVYAMDYIGAFVFAVVWVKFLLKNFPLPEISFIVAGFNFAVAAITVVYFMHKGIMRSVKLPAVCLMCTVLVLTYGYTNNREWSLRMEQKFYEDPVVHVQTTKYQHLVITKNPKTDDVRLYINGNTQFSSLDEKRYHDLLVHPVMAMNPDAKHVLVLGGGDGLAVREILKYSRVESITLVDLDPEMVKLAKTHPIMRELNQDSFLDARISVVKNLGNNISSSDLESIYLETGRERKNRRGRQVPEVEFVAQVNVLNVDADKFVGALHGRQWDVVIIDFPDPSSVELAKLYSREFYHKLKRLMAPNAILSIQSTSPFHAKESYLTIRRTLEAAGIKTIPYRQNIPAFGDWGYYLGWKDQVSVNEMKRRIYDVNSFEVETDFITPEVMVASLAFGKGELEAKKTCVNSLMFPCLVDVYTEDWKDED